jgi:hypothetical protein
MRKSTFDYEAPTSRGTGGARHVFISLLITGTIIAFSSGGFAQSATIDSSLNTSTRGESLARPGQSGQPVTRRVFVRSKSLLVRAAVLEDKLLKRSELKQLGLVITREESDADLILELRHDLFTKYVFSVVETKTHTIVASGKLSSIGGTVADKVAKRFVRDIARMSMP